MNIKHILGLGFMLIQIGNYGIKYRAYNFKLKPMKENAVNRGFISEDTAQKDLKSLRRIMYLPFPLDFIAFVRRYR